MTLCKQTHDIASFLPSARTANAVPKSSAPLRLLGRRVLRGGLPGGLLGPAGGAIGCRALAPSQARTRSAISAFSSCVDFVGFSGAEIAAPQDRAGWVGILVPARLLFHVST